MRAFQAERRASTPVAEKNMRGGGIPKVVTVPGAQSAMKREEAGERGRGPGAGSGAAWLFHGNLGADALGRLTPLRVLHPRVKLQGPKYPITAKSLQEVSELCSADVYVSPRGTLGNSQEESHPKRPPTFVTLLLTCSPYPLI